MKARALFTLRFVLLLTLVLSRGASGDPLDHWTLTPSGLPGTAAAVAYGNGRFVAVGSSGPDAGWLVWSADLEHWTPAICQDHVCAPHTLLGVTFANGRFIAVGSYGWAYTSTNGESWVLNVVPPSDPLLADVCFGDGTFVAVGNDEACGCGFSATSQDGAAWTESYLPNIRSLRGVAAGKGKFVTVGLSDYGTSFTRENIFVSTSALASWHSTASLQTNDLFAVTFGNNIFVAAGEEHYSGTGRILSSPDGETWSAATLPTTNALRSVSFLQGAFVATGRAGTLLTSVNGVDWKLRATGTTNSLGRSFLAEGVVFTIAEGGFVLKSDPPITLQLALGAQPELVVSGLEDRTYRIEATSTLGSTNWDDLGTFVLYSSPTLWRDGTTPQKSVRFYRALLLSEP